VTPFVAITYRPELIVRVELERETQLPDVFVLGVLTHNKLPRQIEGKVLTRSPVVGPPLEKKHIRVFMLLECTPDWPLVSVEIEKRLTARRQVKVTLKQTSTAQDFSNSWRAFCGSNIEPSFLPSGSSASGSSIRGQRPAAISPRN
jgi:hypothetical protein